jgi:hypothetical protein
MLMSQLYHVLPKRHPLICDFDVWADLTKRAAAIFTSDGASPCKLSDSFPSALPKSSGRVITLYRNTILPTSGNSNRSRPQTNYKCLQSYYSSSLSCAQDQNVSVALCCLQWLLGYISAIMGRLPWCYTRNQRRSINASAPPPSTGLSVWGLTSKTFDIEPSKTFDIEQNINDIPPLLVIRQWGDS